MILLDGIVLEKDTNEEKPLGNRRQGTVRLDGMLTLECELGSLDIMPAEIFLMSIREKRKFLVKKKYADICECQKRRLILSYFSILHPFDNVCYTHVRVGTRA